MADEDKIRQELKRQQLEFPVMRDRDEKSVRLVGMPTSYGTPMTLVLDPGGTVRWHGFNGRKETAEQVTRTVEGLLESFYVPTISDFPATLSACAQAYSRGKFGRAYTEASKALKKKRLQEDDLRVARQVVKNLEEGVERLLTASEALRGEGYPSTAWKRLEAASKLFKGMPGANEATKRSRALKKDKGFKRELKAERALLLLEAGLAQPKANRAAIAKHLEKLLSDFKDTPVATRLEKLKKSLE